ncbi:Ionotropic receptor 116 [Cephus cinctus]|uniref:Uncharacterized protein LOC107266559 n=1 Tax=Cephus cinctus TaxID=211228 RepID=A0A3L9LTT5_CEPCN|nr:uncharacterized protein LOC107266559 [Cephus cinctus]RLZ02185.1 Ionotropic receptor 116 [Cephus cinctus]
MEGKPINLLLMIILTSHTSCNALLTTKTHSVNSARTLEILMDLFKNCIPTYQPTICIAYHREMESDFLRKLTKIACLTVVGYTANRDPNLETKAILKNISEKKNLKDIERKRKVNAFLINANSIKILDKVMTKLQNSIWWNSLGLFIAMETNPKTNGCTKASDFIWSMWSYGVLSSIFLCLDELDTPRIYTFNPYDDYAPSSWTRVHRSHSRNGHPWTLYRQEYTHGRDACNEVVFDKTRILQGYPIRVNACPREPTLYIHPSKTGLEKFSGEDGMMITSIAQVLMATLSDISYFDVKCELEFEDANATYQGMMADLALKKVDIGMNMRYLKSYKGLLSTYPHITSQLCFATKLKESVSSWIIIEALFSNMAQSGIFLIFTISMIVTNYFEGKNISNAFIHSIRLILNTPVKNLPKTTAGRFVGYAELLVLLVIHTLLTARFVSVLTNSISTDNIDTLEELQSANYPVLASPSFRDTLENSKLIDRLVLLNNSDTCTTKVIYENMERICVDDCLSLEAIAVQNKLHIGTHKLANNYVNYVARADWPLIDRVNVIIQRTVEAGLTNYWRSSNIPVVSQEHVYLLQNTMNAQSSAVLFKNFKFTFRLFGMGLCVASFIFIAEIIVKFLFHY